MPIKAIVFDIGGVLEITPSTDWQEKWEVRLGLKPGEMTELMYDVWRGGSIGTVSSEEVERRTGDILGLAEEQLQAFLRDQWGEYLGTPNTELIAYFAGLRPRYKTAILSNSFVGAREREQARYGFGDICDFILYSHEVGLRKPDRRIYELLCERLDVQPQEVVFLDDVEPAIEAAQQLGINGIVYKDNAQAIADIKAYLDDEDKT